jgi:hypothetical protein
MRLAGKSGKEEAMTGTPLERRREANADAGALAAIRERIEASGVEYLYRARFCGTVTDWEFQMYAEAAP